MTGSYFSRIAALISAVVAIAKNYRCRGRATLSVALVEVLVERDLEIKEFLGVVVFQPADDQAGAGQRIGNPRNVKEEESALRGVRFDRFGFEDGIAVFVVQLLTWIFPARQRNWERILLRARDFRHAACDVFL